MTTEKKNYNFTLNINCLLYTSKSICFSHIFVYYRSILYSMLLRFFKVESAVIEMIIVNVRGEGTVVAGRAYLRTFFAVPHFHFMTAFPTQSKKETGFFPFPNKHRRPSRILTTRLFRVFTFFSTFSIRPSKIFLFLQRLSSLFFPTLTIWPCIPSFPYCPTGHKSRHFSCQNRIKIFLLNPLFDEEKNICCMILNL